MLLEYIEHHEINVVMLDKVVNTDIGIDYIIKSSRYCGRYVLHGDKVKLTLSLDTFHVV